MADILEDVEKEARADAAENGLTRLAESLGANAAASAVFGTPVERDGVTVIPVARVRWGFGGVRAGLLLGVVKGVCHGPSSLHDRSAAATVVHSKVCTRLGREEA